MITDGRIIELAKQAAIMNWHHAKEKLDEMPENRIRISREKRAWEEVLEIESLMIVEG